MSEERLQTTGGPFSGASEEGTAPPVKGGKYRGRRGYVSTVQQGRITVALAMKKQQQDREEGE